MSTLNTAQGTQCSNSTLFGMTKKAMLLASTVSLSMFMVGCSGNTAEQTTTEESASETTSDATDTNKDTIRIATEGAYAPFNYTDSEGNLIGFDVDLINAICEQMKANCEIQSQDWDGIIPGLKAGKYDAIIAAMSITPERQEQIDFSEPYFTNSLVFVTQEGNAFNPDDEATLEGTSVGTQRSTVSSQWLEENMTQVNAKLYDTLNNAFLDLESGRVDALISDKVPALDWLNSDKAGYTLVGSEIDIDDSFGIAVRKDDALKQDIDAALAEIKANGKYDEISDQYFAVPAK